MKKMSVRQAVDLIKDENTIAVSGFLLAVTAREVLKELGEKYVEKNEPKNLTVMHAAGVGNNKDQGIYEISYEGLVARYITGHFAGNQRLVDLTNQNKIETYNFPQGVISKMYRARSAGKSGELTKVGLYTFCDPRLGGGKLNDSTKEDLVELVRVAGEEYLYYKTPNIDVAIIRGTTADENGNITMEEESAYIDAKDVAMATKASGGKVIAQVKNYVSSESIDRSQVVIPGIFIDAIVVSENPIENHRQTPASFYDPIIAGHNRALMDHQETKFPLDERKVIARRAAKELKKASVVNLGIGIPEGVALVAKEEGIGDEMILTIECGLIGGIPLGGANFGSAANAWGALAMAEQFDFYNGGGLDLAFLGFAEVNEKGDINVSKFGDRIAGCGGFIDISQTTKDIFFCGTLTAGGLKEKIVDGKLVIEQEGKRKKFLKDLDQITYSAEYGVKTNQNVSFITDRCVMKLTSEGLVVTEVAPGIDIQKDIIEQMEFKPIIASDVREMDPALFQETFIGLKETI